MVIITGNPATGVENIGENPEANVENIGENPEANVENIGENPEANVENIGENPEANVENIEIPEASAENIGENPASNVENADTAENSATNRESTGIDENSAASIDTKENPVATMENINVDEKPKVNIDLENPVVNLEDADIKEKPVGNIDLQKNVDNGVNANMENPQSNYAISDIEEDFILDRNLSYDKKINKMKEYLALKRSELCDLYRVFNNILESYVALLDCSENIHNVDKSISECNFLTIKCNLLLTHKSIKNVKEQLSLVETQIDYLDHLAKAHSVDFERFLRFQATLLPLSINKVRNEMVKLADKQLKISQALQAI